MIVYELRDRYSLSLLLKIAGLKKSTYFYAIKHLNYKFDKDKDLGDLIEKIFTDNH